FAFEYAGAVQQRPPHRRGDAVRITAVQPPAQPLPLARVVRSQPDTAHDTRWEAHDVIADIAVAAQYGPVRQRPIEILPLIAADETRRKTPMTHIPSPKQKVELGRCVREFR